MAVELDSVHVTHNEAASRFEATVDGLLCVLEYRMRSGKMAIVHTEVPPAIEGQGIAAKMTRAALEYARANKLPVVPVCPYTAAFMRKHREYADLLG